MTESSDLPYLPLGPTAHYLYYKLSDIQEFISTVHDNLTKIHGEIRDLSVITQHLADFDILRFENINYEPIQCFLEAERQTHNNSPIIFDCPILDRNKYQLFPLMLDDILSLSEEKPKSLKAEENLTEETQKSIGAVSTSFESGTRPMRVRRPRKYDIEDPKRDMIFGLHRLNTTLKQLRRQAFTIISNIESNPEEFQNLASQTKKKIQLLLDLEEIDINEVKTNLSVK